MSLVRIGDKKVRIGGEGYKPTEAEIKEIGLKIGAIKSSDIKETKRVPEKLVHGVPQSLLDEARSSMNQTLLGVANSATMQIPRTVANLTAKMAYGKDTPEVIPPGNLGGQIVGAMMPGGIASRFAQLATSGIKGAGILPSVARMAGTGSIESQAIDYNDLPSRAMGLVGGGLLGGGLGLVGGVAKSVKFGSNKAFRNLAENIKTDMGKVDTAFQNDYSQLMTKSGGKVVSEDLRNSIVQKATGSITKGVNEKYIDAIQKQMANPNLTVQDLHNMKPDIYAAMKAERGGARSGIRDIYNQVNEVIADRTMAGKNYSTLTKRFESYKKEAEVYVRKLITDAEKNLTEVKLKKLKELNTNQKDAFLKLSNLAKSPNLSPEIQRLLAGQKVKDILAKSAPWVVGGVLGAGGMAGYGLIRGARGLLSE